jgi:hypothetical protein
MLAAQHRLRRSADIGGTTYDVLGFESQQTAFSRNHDRSPERPQLDAVTPVLGVTALQPAVDPTTHTGTIYRSKNALGPRTQNPLGDEALEQHWRQNGPVW